MFPVNWVHVCQTKFCVSCSALSEIPNTKTIAGVRIGLIGDRYIVNPTTNEMEESELDLLLAGTDSAILMIEVYFEVYFIHLHLLLKCSLCIKLFMFRVIVTFFLRKNYCKLLKLDRFALAILFIITITIIWFLLQDGIVDFTWKINQCIKKKYHERLIHVSTIKISVFKKKGKYFDI